MSQEHIDLIRRAYRDGYDLRRVDESLRPRFAEDFRFHMRSGWPGRPSYDIDGMTQIWADLDETFTEYDLSPTDFAAVGENVLVTLRSSARMRGSDARIESTIWHVWHLREGVVLEAWTFDDEAEAREAAAVTRPGDG